MTGIEMTGIEMYTVFCLVWTTTQLFVAGLFGAWFVISSYIDKRGFYQ